MIGDIAELWKRERQMREADKPDSSAPRTDFDVFSDNVRHDLAKGRLTVNEAMQKYYERCRYKERELALAQEVSRQADADNRRLRAARPSLAAQDAECICKGNWRAIVKETEPLIGKRFVNNRGEKYRFFGVVHGDDDYYYGMNGTAGMRLLSCVGDLSGHGYTLLPEGMADEPAPLSPRAAPARDNDWVLAMAAALGTDSGLDVPIVPEVEPFRQLFAAVRSHTAPTVVPVEKVKGIAGWLEIVQPSVARKIAADLDAMTAARDYEKAAHERTRQYYAAPPSPLATPEVQRLLYEAQTVSRSDVTRGTDSEPGGEYAYNLIRRLAHAIKTALSHTATINAEQPGGLAERPDLEQAQGDDVSVMGAAPVSLAPSSIAAQVAYTPYAYEEVHKFYEEWPGGLEEIESSLEQFRRRIAELEAQLSAIAPQFAVAGFFKNTGTGWVEVSDLQADEDGVQFLYMEAARAG